MNDKRWVEIRGYEGLYSVSSDGDVRSDRGYRRWKAGRLLVGSNSSPCRTVSLSKNGVVRSIAVANLVAYNFLGPRPKGLEINHKNGNRYDNRLENLEYITHLENIHHSIYVLGNSPRHPVKMTDEYVSKLRELAAGGAGLPELARRFGISKSHACLIKSGKRWGHTLEKKCV